MPKGYPRVDNPMRRHKGPKSNKWPHNREPGFRLGVTHEVTPDKQNKVRTLAAMGALREDIALVLGIDVKTLRKYYRKELDVAAIEANAQVAGKLFKNAMDGNVIAQIFWMKARAGWVDRREVNHNHNIGPMMSHEERLEMLGADPDDQPRQLVDGTAEEVDGPGPDDVGPDVDEPGDAEEADGEVYPAEIDGEFDEGEPE